MSPKGSLRERLAEAVGRVALSLAFAVAALLLALAGCGVLVAALWLSLATLLTPAQAALATGAVVFALAALLALLGRAVVRGRPRRQVPKAAAAEPLSGATAAALVGSELGEVGGEWVRANLGKVMLGALAGGFAIGFSPRLRNALMRRLR